MGICKLMTMCELMECSGPFFAPGPDPDALMVDNPAQRDPLRPFDGSVRGVLTCCFPKIWQLGLGGGLAAPLLFPGSGAHQVLVLSVVGGQESEPMQPGSTAPLTGEQCAPGARV